jgi:hypothetical protein
MVDVEFGDGRLPARFWKKCAVSDGGCWLWIACVKRTDGFGLYSHNGVTRVVHRVAYEALVAPIPKHHDLIRKCEHRHCCNPAHVALQEKATHEHNRIYKARYRHANRPRLRRYGLTGEAYDAMVTGQDGQCAICRKRLEQRQGGVAIDHCHTTNAIRGLLCGPCNVGLGAFRDSEASLSSAIEYLATARARDPQDIRFVPPAAGWAHSCSVCRSSGHNSRTCPERMAKAP